MVMTVKKMLPATLGHLHEAMAFVVAFAEERGFLPGDVEISCILSGDDRFIVEIRDNGIPFDVVSAGDQDVTSGIEERKIGGLGIFLIKRLMDDVTYRREDDKNILRLTVLKNRTAPQDGSERPE
jgi:serine/threonine-protein kinase RsbW